MPSDADRMRLSYIEEPSFGVTPASPTLKDFRYTSESLRQEQTTEDSKEIKDDRQVSDIVRTKVSGQGDLGLEMSYGAHDDILKALLFATAWSTPVTIGPIATISASSTDNSFNDSANGFASLVVNQWVRASGFTNAANNGYFKIVSVTAAKIVVKGGTLVTETAAAGRKLVMGAQIVNGITKTSFTIEKKYSDLTNVFAVLRGMMPNTAGFNVKSDQIITGTTSWLGMNEKSGVASVGTGYTAAPTNEVMAGVDHLNSVNNNLRERLRVGTLGAFSMGAGHFQSDGGLMAYFSDSTMIDYFLSFTEVGMAFNFNDSGNNGYVIDYPAVKFSAGQRVAGGENTDIMADMKWRAKKSATELITMRIARFPGP